MADFNLTALARYLHITEGQVQKMAERGAVPGRRVGGEWKFNPSEIHHWLEDRIGAAGELDLAHMEGALARAADRDGRAEELVSLAEMLPIAGIELELPARTRNGVITEMITLAGKTDLLWDAEAVGAAVRERENLHSTALECGVALLHPRRPMPNAIAQPFVCLGRTRNGIPFGSPRLTELFFLICSTDDAGHLHLLARISRLLATDSFLALLRTATDAHTLHDEIAAQEQALTAEGKA